MKTGHNILGIKLIFNDDNKTLTKEEIDNAVNVILLNLKNKLNVSIK